MQLLQQFSEKSFQAPKIIFKSSKLIDQYLLSYVHVLKDKKVDVYISERATLSGFAKWQFTAKEDLNPRKQVFLLNLKL